MAMPPEDEEHVTKQVVYERTASSRQSTGVIVAIVIIVLALVLFIAMQVRQKPPHRQGEFEVPRTQLITASV